MRIVALVLILLAACGKQEPPVSDVSEREKACWSDLNAASLKESDEESARFEAAMANESAIDEYMETKQLRGAEYDLQYCRRYSQCFDGLTDREHSSVVVKCTKRRLREHVAEY